MGRARVQTMTECCPGQKEGEAACRYMNSKCGALKSSNDFENLTTSKLHGKLTSDLN